MHRVSVRRRRSPPRAPGALSSPVRNLVAGTAFVASVVAGATTGYVLCGWTWGDAFYMVMLTVFTVGYGEVRPVDTVALRAITLALIFFGCTGMIFVTGALVQLITAAQFAEFLDVRRMTSRIEDLRGHVIVCGFGRIGLMLTRELHAGGVAFVVVERDEIRAREAQDLGYLCLNLDATEEDSLVRAGIAHARAVATVLPDDAANVFITLSARSLNRELTIIARGEVTSTERKLLQAGADRVVLPAHIGAERMAELLLFPVLEGAAGPQNDLRRLGLEQEIVLVESGSPWAGLTVGEIEARADEAFLIVEMQRRASGARERPNAATRLAPGDGVLVVGRSTRAAVAGFAARRGDGGRSG
jgi:trk system potassium uptake protein TrkA/voltage-gated potassium channel